MHTIHGFPLEHVFRESYLARLGASFAEFQANPQGTLEKYGQHDAITIMRLSYRPLLPAQVRLRKVLQAQWRAEGTWDDSMAAEGVSAATSGSFLKRIQHAKEAMMGVLKKWTSVSGRPTPVSPVPGEAAVPTRRHDMSHSLS